MDVLYLIDGSGYIYRAYYAVSSLSTSDGLPTNAIYGFTRMIVKLLREVRESSSDSSSQHRIHVAVTFDSGKETFRNELYPDYKANRSECPEDLVVQMPYFRRIVEALGVKSLEKPGFEADDIIGTLAKRFANSGCKVVIVSGDKDLTQLVNGNIEMWDPMRNVRFDSAKVREKFGVESSQIADFLALTGDSSDNIPGARGVGPKSAQALLGHFGNLESLLQHPEKVEEIKGLRGAAKIRKNIECELETIRLSRKLVELDTEVVPFSQVENVSEFTQDIIKGELIRPLFQELEITKLLDSICIDEDLFRADEFALQEPNEDMYSGKDFKIISAEELESFALQLGQQSSFAFDTETTSLDVKNCQLVGMSFSWQEDSAYYLPLICELQHERALNAFRVRELLGPIFANSDIGKVGLNLKYDFSVLTNCGYTVCGLEFDAMLASYVLNPDIRQHSLSALAKTHLDTEMLPYKELVGDKEHIGAVELEKVGLYAAHDAEVSWCLMKVLKPMLGERCLGADSGLEEASLLRVFEDIEMPLVEVLSAMEANGIGVDVAFLHELKSEFDAELVELRSTIIELAGEEFNLNSPKQLGAVLFEKLEISTKGVKKTKSGYSTDASVLSHLINEHPIVEKLVDYRELFKLSSTYVEALIRLTCLEDSRVYASFNQAIAATGRLSSSDPNLQNIPIRNPRGRLIRKAFVAKPGSLLISADYSQIELRVLAHLSGDEGLSEAFSCGEDIHLRTAIQIFGENAVADSEDGEPRRIAKTINFGVLYGMSAFRLANQLGISRRQAQEHIDNYFKRYSRIREYFDYLEERLEKDGYVETLFGRRRYLQSLNTSGRDKGYAVRSMLNAPIQGTAAEIIKVAMINLHKSLEHFGDMAKMVLQVHDELVVEVHRGVLEDVRASIVEQMESAVELSVPLKVDVRVGESWGEML